MSGNTTVIFPKDAHYRPPAGMAIQCIHLLQDRGAMGGPIRVCSAAGWRPGSLSDVTLGVHFVPDPNGPGSIRVDCNDTPRLYASIDFVVKCPACGAVAYGGRIDACSHLFSALATNPDSEPTYACGCGVETAITQMKMSEGALACFAIVLEDAIRPVPDPSLPFWTELEALLGTGLDFVYYTRP